MGPQATGVQAQFTASLPSPPLPSSPLLASPPLLPSPCLPSPLPKHLPLVHLLLLFLSLLVELLYLTTEACRREGASEGANELHTSSKHLVHLLQLKQLTHTTHYCWAILTLPGYHNTYLRRVPRYTQCTYWWNPNNSESEWCLH